jgi:predicted O-linked N-acetylglucosamine transferase (SPINDLY family)
MSDEAIVSFARDAGVDIAIDLNGYTENARPQLFAARLAPVQMGYLGYLGTTGARCIDYLITDRQLTPPEFLANYSEAMAYLPAYQWNEDAALEPGPAGVRADFGLPDEAFIFCSFNNNYKITPAMFQVWMDILRAVPGSVLWIYADSAEAARNLRAEATRRGVASHRILFADKAPLQQHLGRQRLADLMLDTFPYGGGATGGNAIRAGLPMLTLRGRSFASRMGASLLTSAGLGDLAVDSIEAYRRRAIELAGQNDELRALRQRLAARPRTPASSFVAGLQRLYQRALARNRAGLGPAHLESDD